MHPHLCIQCQRYYADFSTFKRHLSRHKSRFASASGCKLQPGLFGKRCRKGLEHVNLGWYECQYCKILVQGAFNLVVHLQKHNVIQSKKRKKKKGKKEYLNGKRVYICKRCQSVFCSKRDFKVHEEVCCVKIVHQIECEFCPEICESQSSLRAHAHQETHYHICTLCEAIFTSGSILRNHMRTHATRGPPISTSCTNVGIKPLKLCKSLTSNRLQDYSVTENGVVDDNHWPEFQTNEITQDACNDQQETQLYPCNLCSHILTTEISWYTHRRAHAELTEHQCPCCEMLLSTSEKLDQHFLIHSGENTSCCSFCGYNFTKITSLLNHEADHIKRPGVGPANKPTGWLKQTVYKCELCNKNVSTPSALSKHARKEHDGFRPFSCEICDKRYILRTDLIRHHSTHSGEKPFKCLFCSKLFAHKKYLVTHERIHTGESPYKCKYCPKEFSSKDSSMYHERTHTGEKPYICKTCQKPYKTSSALRYHERSVHSNEKFYECEHCNKQYIQKHDLTIHIRTHTGEKPFKCEVVDCSKAFVSATHLTRHKNTVHGGKIRDKSFECQLCDKAYFEDRYLIHHLQSKHAGSLPSVAGPAPI